ncbi:MAG: hypothetical protein MZU79_06270 [Anaerotruncus sp.]|nr:hypothetical protein [Anaerotruncus sp.]
MRFDRLRLGDDRRGPLLPGRGLGASRRGSGRRPRWSRSPRASSSSTPCSSACPSSTARSATPSSPSPWRARPSRSSSSVISKPLAAKPLGQGVTGGLSALAAVNLFPLVKYATGVAPCVTGTAYPLVALLRADRRRAVVPDRPARARRRARSWPPSKAGPGACAGPPPPPSPCRSAPWSS